MDYIKENSNSNSEIPNSVITDSTTNNYIFKCPHCDLLIEVPTDQVNCHIFRHGFLYNKDSNGMIQLLNQMNPHTPKDECERLKSNDLIIGCGRPFKFVRDISTSNYRVEICDYI